MPLVGTSVRSKSVCLEGVSVGLRLSEIDGHFEVAISDDVVRRGLICHLRSGIFLPGVQGAPALSNCLFKAGILVLISLFSCFDTAAYSLETMSYCCI